jgi:hypothetical protein
MGECDHFVKSNWHRLLPGRCMTQIAASATLQQRLLLAAGKAKLGVVTCKQIAIPAKEGAREEPI